MGFVSQIRHGDTVIFTDSRGHQVKGKAVMRSSHGGWVVNIGGRYGTPALVDDDNINAVYSSKKGYRGRVGKKRSRYGLGKINIRFPKIRVKL